MAGHILIVEDNPVHRLILTDFLKSKGFTVFCLNDGNHFFEALESERPDLVLLDLYLPHLNGFELLKQLHQSEEPRVPVVVVSACAFPEEQEQSRLLGARRHVTKPISLEGLTEVIMETLAEAGATSHSIESSLAD